MHTVVGRRKRPIVYVSVEAVIFIFVLLFLPVSYAQNICGYERCNLGKAGMINIHIIPHTHDDTGWRKTVDQYYYGARPDIRPSGVQYILDTTIEQMWKDPAKRFVYAEIAFMYRWWKEIDEATKSQVRELVNQGRLEFVLGGWCVNDEGSTHYNALIDQHALGLQFLLDNFGECGLPKVGWQIDTFGHSREQASLFAQHGMDAMFVSRIDYQDKEARMNSKRMEFVWLASQNQGDASAMFTHVLRDGYGPPTIMFPQIFEPVMDDPDLEDYNVPYVQQLFVESVKAYLPNYDTEHMIFMAGEDFEYENARKNFKNTDKFIKYANGLDVDGKTLNVFYTTPACYVAAVNAEHHTYTSITDDMMPLGTGPNNFWSGYFTSRSALKGFGRSANNLLQVCKQMDVLAQLQPGYDSQPKIDALRHAVAVLQHHDAITGTESQFVADDYALRLYKASLKCGEVINEGYKTLMVLDENQEVSVQRLCPLMNVSYCPAIEDSPDQFSVTFFNPIGRPVQHWARIPVSGTNYEIVNATGDQQILNIFPISNETMAIPEGAGRQAKYELVFKATLPALGFQTYLVALHQGPSIAEEMTKVNEDKTISNDYIRLTVSGSSGMVTKIQSLRDGIESPLTQNFHFYVSHSENPTSSAYTFRPNSTSAYPISQVAHTTVIESSTVSEFRQVFSDWSSQVIRIYPGSEWVEFEWTIGPVPEGREVISRYKTDLQSQQLFYTDSNGREMIQRRRDYRPSWEFVNTEPVAGNYFPINSRIYIQDTVRDIQLTVLTDRSHGGSSLQDGNMEIMLHRRMGDLNETGANGKGLIVRGRQWMCLSSIERAPRAFREMSQNIFMSPITSVASNSLTFDDYITKYNMEWSGLSSLLPANVHLLTLMQWNKSAILLRLEHFYEKNDNPVLSKNATVSLKSLFAPFPIVSVEEQALGGDRPLSKTKRFNWTVLNHGVTNGDMSRYVEHISSDGFDIVLKPMQIRTFLVKTKEDVRPSSSQSLTCFPCTYIVFAILARCLAGVRVINDPRIN